MFYFYLGSNKYFIMNHSISFWEQDTYFSHQDFVIVGSGLVGLWTAYELKKKFPKAKITILERGVVPTGASTRNAGFACFGSPTEILSDLKTMGENELWTLVEMRYKGIEKMKTVLGSKAIGFDECGGFECLQDRQNLDDMKLKINYLNKGLQLITGVIDTFKWSKNEKLISQGLSCFHAMIENELEGGIHSGKLIQALSHSVQQSGVQIIYGIEVKGWQNNNEYLIIDTTHYELKTHHLIIATNAFSNLLCPDLKNRPARGQILVTEPIEHLKLKGTFHFDEGYYYFRNVGNRVLLGGARNTDIVNEETTDFETSEFIQNKLKNFLQQHIIKDIEYKISNKWSGIMAFTENKMPMIKKVQPHVHCVVCCNGMGVALSPIIAEKVADIF